MSKIKKGFTLVEVIIVLAIIAIVAAIAVPNLTKVRESSKVKADERSIEAINRITRQVLADNKINLSQEVKILIHGSSNIQVQPVTAEVEEIDAYFNGVNKPQTRNATHFEINIDLDGNVETSVMGG